MGGRLETEGDALGVLGLAEGEGRGARVRDYDWPKDEPPTLKYLLTCPIVPLL